MPHVTIHVLPFSAGAAPAPPGAMLAVLRMPDRELPDIGYLEQRAAGRYFRSRSYLDYFRHVLNMLALTAESAGPPQSALAAILTQT
jgi:hypothetical protein